MARVLALLGAILLIAAALVARSILDDESGDDGDGGGDGGASLAVACIPELREACEAVDRDVTLTIEDPGETIARIADGDDVDAWITLDPWPAMASFLDDSVELDDPIGVATSDLVVLARTARLPDRCDPPAWTCLVDVLGDSVAAPAATTALGVLVLGHAATDFFGGPFAANDLADPALADRLAALDLAGRDPLEDLRVGLPEPAATGALEVQLASLGVRLEQFDTGPGASPATVAVVVAGDDADRIAEDPAFTAALADLGWDVVPDAATTGLPNAGVLVALQEAVG
jgi:hypothetical protein